MRTVLAAWWALAGALLVGASLVPWLDDEIGFAAMPHLVSALIGVVLTVGGCLCLAGLAPLGLTSKAWRFQRAGCLLAGAAWVSKAVAGAIAESTLYHPLTSAGMACLAAAWLARVIREERRVRDVIEGTI